MKTQRIDTAEATQALSLRQNMVWNSVGSFTNMACQYLMGIVIVRLSGGFDAAGVYSLALSVYYVFSTVAAYRMTTMQISDVQGENTTGEYLSFTFLTCGIAFVLTLVYLIATCERSVWLPITIYLLYRYAMIVIAILHSCCQLHMRMDYGAKSYLLQGLLSLVLFIAVFWFTNSLTITFASMFVCVVLVGVLYTYPRARLFGPIKLGISFQKASHLLVSCAPVVIAGVLLGASASIPKQYLSVAMGTAVLGAYASVSQPVTVVQTFVSYVYTPLISYFVQAFRDANTKRLRKLLLKTASGIAVVFVVCSLGLALFGEPVLVFLCGEIVQPYVYLLQPLTLFAMCTAIAYFINDLSMALRCFRACFVGGALQFVLALACMVPCISAFGAVGVSIVGIISCLGASVVAGIMLLQFARRSLTQQDGDK